MFGPVSSSVDHQRKQEPENIKNIMLQPAETWNFYITLSTDSGDEAFTFFFAVDGPNKKRKI